MKTRLSPAAAEDLADILKALSAKSPAAARGFRERFRYVRIFIGEFPRAGRETDDASLRCVNMGNFPYLVFFEIVDAHVVIMRVMHGARDPDTMPGRSG